MPTAKKPAAKKKPERETSALVGQTVPAFTLLATGGVTVKSAAWKGQNTVLYFYPRDATPGCTEEGHDFTRLHKKFKSAGAEIFGISRDTLKAHDKFKLKEAYSFDLLSDVDETACALFGVMKDKNMYGKKVRGIERSTFVIDRKGKVVKEWRGVRIPGHAEEVLEFVKTLT